jgi:hypothetical protein
LDGSGAEPGLSRLSAALGTAAQDARSAAESTRALLPAAAAAGALKPGCGGNGRKAHEASLARIESYMNASSAGLRRAHRAVKGLISGTSEGPAASPSPCHPAAGSVFTSFVTSTAGTIGVLFEEALRDRRITPKALFDANYVKVPGTEPEQYLTGFTVLATSCCRPISRGRSTWIRAWPTAPRQMPAAISRSTTGNIPCRRTATALGITPTAATGAYTQTAPARRLRAAPHRF